MVRTFKFAITVGMLIATLVTAYVTIREWIENPGGIFHGVDGTRWKFVFDTAISWFWPVLLLTVFVALVGHLVFHWWLAWRKS